jgi:hypothetical protein
MFNLSTYQIVLALVFYVVPAFFLMMVFEEMPNKTKDQTMGLPLVALLPVLNVPIALWVFSMDLLRGKQNRYNAH